MSQSNCDLSEQMHSCAMMTTNGDSLPYHKVGINGFGRIGKLLARTILDKKKFQIVAINDPCIDAKGMAYFLCHDSVHGSFCCDATVDTSKNTLIVCGQQINVFSELDPSRVPWGELGAEVVAECSGKFTSREKCQAHLQGGAPKVLLSAPAKDLDTPTFILGVNHNDYDPSISVVSNASCTTNCLAPLAKLIHEKYGIEEGLMTTIHALTASQKVVDGPGAKDLRLCRSAGRNIIPASTGATIALSKVLPDLEGRLSGLAFRVPVENVSVVDLTVHLKNPMGDIDEIAQEIRQIEQNAGHEMHGIIGATDEPIVSSDFNGDERSCIVDLTASILLTPYFAKFVAYYDNEWAYAVRMVRIKLNSSAIAYTL